MNPEVGELLLERWRSGRHMGEAKPYCKVEIRTGRFVRGFSPHVMLDGTPVEVGYIPLTPRSTPWHFRWIPRSGWKTVPHVAEVTVENDFDGNGVGRTTIQIDNVRYKAQEGMAGLYHAIERGYLAPYRGYTPPARPGTGDIKNDWYQLLAMNAQIRIWEGYGEDTAVPVFTGLIDDLDLESKPDRATVVARDFGQLLVDQRFMGQVKDRHIKDPVFFADRRFADDLKSVGGAASASSTSNGAHPARLVTDKDTKSAWHSDGHNGPNFTEWVQIKVPAGRYEDVWIRPDYPGQECYIGIYGRGDVKVDGVAQGEGWIEVDDGGEVPGGNGGWPYMRKVPQLRAGGWAYRINHRIEVGDNTTIRIGLRNLDKRSDGDYYAGIRSLAGRKRTRKKDAKRERWILVDDVSDVVKIILRWAGFREWEIEDTGVRLQDKIVFNRSDFLIDAIKKMAELVNYVFFIGQPSTHDLSTGVPIFRQTRAMQDPPSGMLTVRDKDLLTGIKVKLTDEPLAAVIRVRGKLATDEEGGQRDWVGGYGGFASADTLSAYQSFYRPPWAVDGPNYRLAGIIKHVVHVDEQLSSKQECEVAARFIAAGEALKSATAIVEIPGNPYFELDDQVYLLDSGTGMATRLWIAQRSSTWTSGENASWTQSMGGALLDMPDLVAIRAELEAVYQQEDEEPIVMESWTPEN